MQPDIFVCGFLILVLKYNVIDNILKNLIGQELVKHPKVYVSSSVSFPSCLFTIGRRAAFVGAVLMGLFNITCNIPRYLLSSNITLHLSCESITY